MTNQDEVNLGRKLQEIRLSRNHLLLQELRLNRHYSLEQLAGRLGVTKSYLSKIENGHKPVPDALLQKYVQVFSESAKSSNPLGGHEVQYNKVQYAFKMDERNDMNKHVQIQPPGQELQVNVNPDTTPIHYSDWQGVSTNDGGIVLSFGQIMAPVPTANVVSRIGMSHTQAKELYRVLGDNLKQFYGSKNMEF